ncbi:glycoside hydrolase family 2 protein [Microbacterium lacticum]
MGVTEVRGGVDVTLTARALAVDVALLVDKIVPHAVAAEGLFTLLPGESRTVHVTGLTVQDAGALADPRVLRTANQLVTPHLVLDGGVR